MALSKNYTEVIIGGKVVTLGGAESEEYLQKVSNYLNHKMDECEGSEGYRKQSAEMRNILLALNIADDYFKAKNQRMMLESDVEDKDQEMYDLKHELISVQNELDQAKTIIESVKSTNLEFKMKVLELETKIKSNKL